MRLLFIADGRSPIAVHWIRHWVERGDDVHLVSTFPCVPDLKLASLSIIPVAFSGVKSFTAYGTPGKDDLFRGADAIQMRMWLRQWFGPLTLSSASRALREIIKSIQPGLVHAMRIPYEGMLASIADPGVPLVVSVWGNDLTLHAPASPLMRVSTHRVMERADALHTDCQRDVRLAHAWGFPDDHPVTVLPGNGGINTKVFYSQKESGIITPAVINPRGFRTYVRNDTFFRAIPLILARQSHARFICPNMAGEQQAERWLADLKISHAVELLPSQTEADMADLYRRAQVLVSPSTHDGTPNSLLEGMACGCFPIAGDLESIREWITPSLNGLLVDPADPQALAEAVLLAMENKDLRAQAAQVNEKLIAERAEYQHVMAQAEEFYTRMVLKA